MFDFLVRTPAEGYTHASLSDFSGYVAFTARMDGRDVGCRVSAVVQQDGQRRRSHFSVGVDGMWGPYFSTKDVIEEDN